MEIIKNRKIELLYIIIGLLIIFWTFWNRLLRYRLPKTFDDFMNPFMIFFIFFNVILLTFTIMLYIWQKFKPKKTSNKFVEYLLKFDIINVFVDFLIKFGDTIKEGPKTVYKCLIFNQYNVAHILEIPFVTLSRFIKNLPAKYVSIFKIIHIMFSSLPRIIPPLIFIIEIFLFNQLNYFYKSLSLYLISLSYNILLWILEHLSDFNIYYATAHIKITYHTREDYDIVFQDEIPIIENAVDIVAHKNDRPLFEWFVYIYETYVDIKWLFYRLDLIKQDFKDFERILISLLFLIGWLYILFTIL